MGAKMKSQLINKLKQEIKFIESKSEKDLEDYEYSIKYNGEETRYF